MSESLHLRVIKDNDAFIVVDQHGRRVEKVTSLTLNASHNAATEVTMKFYATREGSEDIHINRRRK